MKPSSKQTWREQTLACAGFGAKWKGSEMTKGIVRDNKTRSRFELDAEGGLAFANYRTTTQAVIITHTETPPALRGRGIASELVEGALALIRADGRKVIAGCGFVVAYLGKHPEYADLVT
jgi:predicted GNAT family acetyltransferase